MDTRRALQMARDAEVDLVEVAPNSEPPVCRLLDYGKLLYLSAKKEKESKRGQKSTEQKEVRFRPNIGTHDLDAKVRKVREFINDGSKVKLTVRFRGREAAHQQLGLAVLRRVADEMKDEIRWSGRQPWKAGRFRWCLYPLCRREKNWRRSGCRPPKTRVTNLGITTPMRYSRSR